MIPADRPYVGLLVIKIFPAYPLPGRSEAIRRQNQKEEGIAWFVVTRSSASSPRLS